MNGAEYQVLNEKLDALRGDVQEVKTEVAELRVRVDANNQAVTAGRAGLKVLIWFGTTLIALGALTLGIWSEFNGPS